MVDFAIDTRTLFEGLSDEARVWVYQANRKMTEDELNSIKEKSLEFVHSWESHGSQLKAACMVIDPYFLLFSVDEKTHEASGCSIDKSVHFVKNLQNEFSIDFFDRTKVAYIDKDNSILLISLSEVKDAITKNNFDGKYLIFNNLITNLKELRTNWLVSAEQSWLSRFL